MSGTVSSPTACWIDATGIHAPTYAQVLAYLQGQFQSIYGDVYLGNDTQDGQWLAIIAAAINDANSATMAAYNSFSPSTAQGAGLSSVVKTNGIQRASPSNSQVDLVITGVPGTTISNGYVRDGANQQWDLPISVVIPPSGQVVATAIADQTGSVSATPGSVTTIGTPTRGWQSVTNLAAAVVGNPVETDSALRQRQTLSTMNASITASEDIQGAVEALPGVTRMRLYENDTASTDSNGIPSHSIALVIEGGDAQRIADTIASRKTPGAGTFGTTVMTVTDKFGVPNLIRFFVRVAVPITVQINITALTGYTDVVGGDIASAVAAYINGLHIGAGVSLWALAVPAKLPDASGGTSYFINSVNLARGGATPAATNIGIAFNEAAIADLSTVTVSVGG